MENEEIINCERARIEELQNFSKWLKQTFHTGEFMKPEFRKWINLYAQEKYAELNCEIEFHKKQIEELKVVSN